MKMTNSMWCKSAGMLITLVIAVLLPGCLVLSATESFSQRIGDFTVSSGSFDSENVDLSENSTYDDHKEDIELVDRLGFSMNLVSLSGVPATVSVYISDDPALATPAEVASKATLIFEDLEVPTAGRSIDYEESLDLLLSFPALQGAVEAGTFTVYAIAGGDYNVAINDVIVTITMTFTDTE